MFWRKKLKDLAQLVDLVVVGPADQLAFLIHLVFHQLAGIGVTGDIADGKVDAFLDDQPVTADVGHACLVLLLEILGAFVFGFDGVEKDVVGLLGKRKEAQLRVIEKIVDEMKLYKHLLLEELGAIEKYLVVLEVIDVLHLERGHAYLPDHPARRGPELYILRCDQCLRQIGSIVILGQHLVRKIEIILVDETTVKTLSLLV